MSTNTKELNYSAFTGGAEERLGKIQEATADGKPINFGWIPPHARTTAQNRIASEVTAELPRFNIRGRFSAAERRYPLWKANVALTGNFIRYVWQQTGSCVGAGGQNARSTLAAVEIALKGEREVLKDFWWLYTYGRCRLHAGMKGQGEGSFGPAWWKAAMEDGGFEIDPEGEPDLPDYKVQDDWLVQPAKVEMTWSAGDKISQSWLRLGKLRPVKTIAQMRNKVDCFEAIANGYPLVQASSFGFSGAKVKGTKFPIRVATWNGTWHHMTYIDEAWDHPELNGIYYRWGNNWGPDAHGTPTGDEPPGGVYIHEDTMDRLCKEGEVAALSGEVGYPARELNYSAF